MSGPEGPQSKTAKIYLHSRQDRVTLARATFQFQDLAPGDHQVLIQAAGFAPWTGVAKVIPGIVDPTFSKPIRLAPASAQ